MSKYIIKTFFIAFMISILVLATAVQATTDIEAKPDRLTISAGQIFDILLYVTTTDEIDTVAVNVSMWDPSLAEVMDISRSADGETPLFEDSTIWIGGKEIDNDLGYLKHIVWGSTIPTQTPGYFATITFKAKKAGEFVFNIPPGEFGAARAGERIQSSILSESFSQQIPNEEKKNNAGVETSFFTWQMLIGIIVMVSLLLTALVFVLLRKKQEPKPMPLYENKKPESTLIKVKKL